MRRDPSGSGALRRAAVAAVVLFAAAAPAGAHRLAPALLAIDEAADGTFAVLLKTPLQSGGAVSLSAQLPKRCVALAEPQIAIDEVSFTELWTADCGPEGLSGGTLGVSGLAESRTNALLRIAMRDGRRLQAVLHDGAPTFTVPAQPSPLSVFSDYLRLGALHIGTGLDHLLFVFGLLLLVDGVRSLVATVTAFTVGHSVTLSLAALGVVNFPTGPIEVAIAVTILVLALELAREPGAAPSALRRRPWAVAFAFGLLHGFGFAGALAEVGLPDADIPLALFSFNAGIEVGQLAFVVAVLSARAALGPALRKAPTWLLRVPVTAMGALAAYWCLDRGAALF